MTSAGATATAASASTSAGQAPPGGVFVYHGYLANGDKPEDPMDRVCGIYQQVKSLQTKQVSARYAEREGQAAFDMDKDHLSRTLCAPHIMQFLKDDHPGAVDAFEKGIKTVASTKAFLRERLEQTHTLALQDIQKDRLDQLSLIFKTLIRKPDQQIAFFQRVQKVWIERTFRNPERVVVTREFVLQHTKDPLIDYAIAEDMRVAMVDNLILYLDHFYNAHDFSWLTRAAKLYAKIPLCDRKAIETLIGKLWLKKNGSTVFTTIAPLSPLVLTYMDARAAGKACFDACVLGTSLQDLDIVLVALYLHLKQGTLAPLPNLALRCNEAIRWPFFKIKDSMGKTKGYILGSCHCLPPEFALLRRKIQRSFYKATIYIPEIDADGANRPPLDILKHYANPKGPKICIDSILLARAKLAGKVIVEAESYRDRPAQGKLLQDPALYDKPLNYRPTLAEEEAMLSVWAHAIRTGFLSDVLTAEETDRTLKSVKPEKRAIFEKFALHDRNATMVQTVDNVLKNVSTRPSERPFVTVGAAHLPDAPYSVGVLHRLIDKGWTIAHA